MAKQYKLIVSSYHYIGILIFLLIFFTFFLSFFPFLIQLFNLDLKFIFFHSHFLNFFKFSFIQSFFSSFFSIVLAIFISKSLYQRYFWGRDFLLKICTVIIILPSLVIILGILNIYGKKGWLFYILKYFNINYSFSIYGLTGILITHIFYNMPLAIFLFFNILNNIPLENRFLGMQLKLNRWNYFFVVEWPYLKKQVFFIFSIIFILCFNSFSTILTFGGKNNTTTISLAIYQSLNYEYNLGNVAFFSILQIFFCILMLLISQSFSKKKVLENPSFNKKETPKRNYIYNIQDNFLFKILDFLIIFFFILFIFPPIISIIFDGFHTNFLKGIFNFLLWKATLTSLIISLLSGLLCIIITIFLLWVSREFSKHKSFLLFSIIIENFSLIIFSTPNIVLITGLFLIFNNIDISIISIVLVIFINSLMSLPYSIRILRNSFYTIGFLYDPLCISLNIKGWNRLKIVEFPYLKNLISKAIAFSCILSIGDFDIMTFFGNEYFCTLSCYLYEQIHIYENQFTQITALFLLIFCLFLFTIIEFFSKFYANTK